MPVRLLAVFMVMQGLLVTTVHGHASDMLRSYACPGSSAVSLMVRPPLGAYDGILQQLALLMHNLLIDRSII